MKKFLFLSLLLILPFSLAANQYLELDYSSGAEVVHETSFSNFLLKINNDYGECKYFPLNDISYSEMIEFDESSSNFYKENFEDLNDGEYVYYIKCLENESSMRFSLIVDSVVTGKISLSKDAPLSGGRIEVDLETSKIVLGKPELSYSLDGEKYIPLVLEGFSKDWKTYLILDERVGEDVLFFKFKAKDLQGRVGDFLTEGSVFEVDTVKPSKLEDIETLIEDDKFKINWHSEDEFEKVNIYRNKGAEPDYSDFYDDSYKNNFIDDDVDLNKIYYYKFSLVDYAGNEGPLSETFVLSLSDYSDLGLGLSAEKKKRIDDFLVLVSEKKSYLEKKKSSFESFDSIKKNIFERLGYYKDFDLLFSELRTIETGLERLRIKEMEDSDFEREINSYSIKFDVVDKKIIEDFSIIEKESIENNLSDDLIKKGASYLSLLGDDSYLINTRDVIEEYDLEIKSNYYLVRVSYYDGSSRDLVIVDKRMDSTMENSMSFNFFEVFPDFLSKDSDILEIKNLKYDFVFDNVLKLNSDSKSLFYYYEGDEIIKTEMSFVYFGENKRKERFGLTGHFAFDFERQESSIIIFVLVVLGLFFYLLYITKRNRSEEFTKVVENLRKLRKFISNSDLKSANLLYKKIKFDYSNLNREEKGSIYFEIENLRDKILVKQFKEKLSLFQKFKNNKAFEDMENVFSKLSFDSREKIGPIFFRIKKEFLNKK